MNREKESQLPMMQVNFIDTICLPIYEVRTKITPKPFYISQITSIVCMCVCMCLCALVGGYVIDMVIFIRKIDDNIN